MIRLLVLHYPRPDLSAARSLFEAALGMEFTEQVHLSDVHYWHADLASHSSMELWPASSARPPSRVQLAFMTEDLTAAEDRILAVGFPVRHVTGTGLVHDPNGNLVALMQQ